VPIQTAFGPLRRVYVRSPQIEDLEAWRAHGWRAAPDPVRAAGEHASTRSRLIAPSSAGSLGGMPERVHNFSAGPGILPLPVLEQAQRELVSLPGLGASALEVSHRGAWFTGVIEEAEANLRDLLAIPRTHRVVFCQGGATMQFSMSAMNLLRGTGRRADYVLTGSWGAKAVRVAE
jgi:hypothetical protein